LAKKPNNQNNERNKPVELFLFLSDLCKDLRPKLPVDYKKAITDCLREIGKY
ncbi:2498_t:CDS:2, partial [Rhizophagus irregularis]